MPDNAGKMSPEEIAKIIKYLQGFGKAPTCEVCKNESWGVSEHLVSPIPFAPLPFISIPYTSSSPVAYPQFMICCTKCQNTKYFGAVLAGIIDVQSAGTGNPETKQGAKDVRTS